MVSPQRCPRSVEQRILRFSLWAAVGFSFTAITMGIATGSQFLLFDGTYSLISVGASGLSLFTAKFMAREDHRRFPFGKGAVEALILLIKYGIIFSVLVASAISAVFSLFHGGRTAAFGAAALYALVGTVTCWAAARYIRKKQGASPLLEAEGNQWTMDAWISAAALAAFGFGLLLQPVPALQPWLPYLDPLLVLVVSVGFTIQLLRQIWRSLRSLLDMAPSAAVHSSLETTVKELVKKYRFTDSYLRVSQGHDRLWIEIDFIIDSESLVQSINQQDNVREEAARRFYDPQWEQWLTISFTADKKWAV